MLQLCILYPLLSLYVGSFSVQFFKVTMIYKNTMILQYRFLYIFMKKMMISFYICHITSLATVLEILTNIFQKILLNEETQDRGTVARLG